MEPQDSKDLIDLVISGGLGLAALVYLSRLIERLIKSIENYASLERAEVADRLTQIAVKIDRLLVNQERIIVSQNRQNYSGIRPKKDIDYERE